MTPSFRFIQIIFINFPDKSLGIIVFNAQVCFSLSLSVCACVFHSVTTYLPYDSVQILNSEAQWNETKRNHSEPNTIPNGIQTDWQINCVLCFNLNTWFFAHFCCSFDVCVELWVRPFKCSIDFYRIGVSIRWRIFFSRFDIDCTERFDSIR